MREFKQSITGEASQPQQQQPASQGLPAAQQQSPLAAPQQQQSVSVEGSVAESPQQSAPVESQRR
jgi:hypothetical protein